MNTAKLNARAELLADCMKASGGGRLRVFGSSMWPALRAGDEIVVERVKPGELQRGNIVAVLREGRLFVHRLEAVRCSPTGLEVDTRGLTMAASDPAAAIEQVLGVVVRVVRNGREFSADSKWLRMQSWSFAKLAPLSPIWFPAALAVKRLFGISPRAARAA